MRLVTAVIKPHTVEEVKRALGEYGVQGMTVAEVRGHGRQRGHTETYRGAEYTIDFVPKIRVDVLVTETQVGDVIDLIIKAARTGQVGDGKVWVTPVEEVVRIRTGEQGPEAI